MAEHDSEREPEDGDVPLGGRRGDPADNSSGEEQPVPFDEDAAWRAIVAGYGEEPPDPPGTRPFRSVEDLALPEAPPDGSPDGPPGRSDESVGTPADKSALRSSPRSAPADKSVGKSADQPSEEPSGQDSDESGPSATRPLGGSVAFAPGVGSGPRDYRVPEADEADEDDEGHFVPPEPPPLPESDATARFAWLGVVGGPVLLLLAVLLGWDMTWWLATLGIGGFLGGFATLVTRMKDGDEDDDPGRGAVV